MDHFHLLDQVTDISTGKWIDLRALAEKVLAAAKKRGLQCRFEWPNAAAKKRTTPEPDLSTVFHTKWAPTVTLSVGLDEIFDKHASKEKRIGGDVAGGGMCAVNQQC